MAIGFPAEASAKTGLIPRMQEAPKRDPYTSKRDEDHRDDQVLLRCSGFLCQLEGLQLIRHRITSVGAVESPEQGEHGEIGHTKSACADNSGQHVWGCRKLGVFPAVSRFAICCGSGDGGIGLIDRGSAANDAGLR